MMVTDLSHFLGLPEEAPGPPCRLAGHLGDVIRALKACDAGEPRESALPASAGHLTAPAPAGGS